MTGTTKLKRKREHARDRESDPAKRETCAYFSSSRKTVDPSRVLPHYRVRRERWHTSCRHAQFYTWSYKCRKKKKKKHVRSKESHVIYFLFLIFDFIMSVSLNEVSHLSKSLGTSYIATNFLCSLFAAWPSELTMRPVFSLSLVRNQSYRVSDDMTYSRESVSESRSRGRCAIRGSPGARITVRLIGRWMKFSR